MNTSFLPGQNKKWTCLRLTGRLQIIFAASGHKIFAYDNDYQILNSLENTHTSTSEKKTHTIVETEKFTNNLRRNRCEFVGARKWKGPSRPSAKTEEKTRMKHRIKRRKRLMIWPEVERKQLQRTLISRLNRCPLIITGFFTGALQ